MIFGHNKRKLNQEAFYLDKDPIEITHEYKYLGIDLYSHGYFEPSNKKKQRIAGIKALMGTLRKEAIVGVTCWELESHLVKALVLPTFTYGIEIWGGDLKNSHWKGMKMHMMSHLKVRYLTTYHILCAKFGRTSHRITHSQAHYMLSTKAHPHLPLLVRQWSNLTFPTLAWTWI